jgi:hypothetical protein
MFLHSFLFYHHKQKVHLELRKYGFGQPRYLMLEILAIQEAEIKEGSRFETSPGKKLGSISTNKPGVWREPVIPTVSKT